MLRPVSLTRSPSAARQSALPARAVTQRASTLRLVPADPADRAVESYRRLADVFHDVLAEESLDAVLDRIAGALSELIPYDALTIYQADEAHHDLVPVLARDKWAREIM